MPYDYHQKNQPSLYPTGISGYKTFPGCLRLLPCRGSRSGSGNGLVLALVVVAEGYGQRVGSIHKAGVFLKPQGVLQHLPYLFFGGITPAGYRLLYLSGGVLYGVQPMHHAGGNGHTLRTAQFQHTLHVLAKEGRLYSYRHRLMVPYQGFHLLEDEFQPFGMILLPGQLQYPHFHQRNTIFVHGDQSVAHNKRSGVYAQDNIRGGFQYKLASV